MGDLSPHFDSSEFACKDCGSTKVSGDLVNALEELRTLAGLAIVIDCGYRCPDHNKTVGGVSASQHMEGTAADLRIPPLSVTQMYELALKVPAFRNGGIGVYDSHFIHVDVRGKVARWARVAGKYIGIEESGLLHA
jgi:uncharacterized protein YcbK (DUF882 family)